MKIEVSMTVDKQMFEVGHWWATSPEFALAALRSQLAAAAVVWPELAALHIENVHKPTEIVDECDHTFDDGDGA